MKFVLLNTLHVNLELPVAEDHAATAAYGKQLRILELANQLLSVLLKLDNGTLTFCIQRWNKHSLFGC